MSGEHEDVSQQGSPRSHRECSVVREQEVPYIHLTRRVFNQSLFDEEFGFVEPDKSLKATVVNPVKENIQNCSGKCFIHTLLSFFPIIHWLPKYNVKQNLLYDVVAGITVGILHIPQGLAYALLAGVDPVYGLYTAFFPSLFYMIFGTSRHVSHGVFSIMALMSGTVRYKVLPEAYDLGERKYLVGNFSTTTTTSTPTSAPPCDSSAENSLFDDPSVTPIAVLTTLTLAVGIFQGLMGALHLGFMSSYLSDQVISGFTTGAAVHVLTAQINKIMGVTVPRHTEIGKLIFTWIDLAKAVPDTNVPTFVTSCVCILFLVVGKEIVNPPIKTRIPVLIPFDLLAIIIATAVSYFANIEHHYDITVVNHIPTGLPEPKIPRLDLITHIWSDAVGIAIVGVAVNLSLAKLFAKKFAYKIDSNQELFGMGAVNCLVSVFSCWPTAAALARSVVSVGAGIKTQLASVFGCSLVLIIILWFGPLFEPLPMCVLASIIVVALKGMFVQLGQLKKLWPVSKMDFSIWLLTFLATAFLDVKEGLVVGIVFALLSVIFRTQWPPRLIMGNIDDTDLYRDIKRYKLISEIEDIKLFRFDSSLVFANAELFQESLYEDCKIDLAKALEWVEQRKQEKDSTQRVRVKNVHDMEDGERLENGKGVAVDEEKIQHPPDCPDFVIIDCSCFSYIDSMGLNTLKDIYEDLGKIGVRCLLASCKAPVRDMMAVTDFYKTVPKSKLYLSVHDAVVAAGSPLTENDRCLSTPVKNSTMSSV